MKTKKNAIRWWVVLTVILLVFTTVSFALPFSKTAVFVVSYLFGLASIFIQIYVIRTAFYQGEDIKSKFYGFPIVRVGVFYLIAQMILSLTFMALASIVPVWFSLLIDMMLAGVAVVGMIAAQVARDEVVQQDEKQTKNISLMRSLQAQVMAIKKINTIDELTGPLEHLAESLRYSDPVSSEILVKIEGELTAELAALQIAVSSKNTTEVVACCRKAETILAERNEFCKLQKNKVIS